MAVPEVTISIADSTHHFDVPSSPEQPPISAQPEKRASPLSSPQPSDPQLSETQPQPQPQPQTQTQPLPRPADRQPGERKEFHQKIFKTPKETGMAFVVTAQNKAAYSWPKLALLSFVAGIFVSFSGIFSIVVARGVPTWPEGIQRLLFGLTFSFGLSYIVVMGAELFTGNTMFMTVGLLNRSINWKDYARSLVVSFLMNFVGCVFAAAFFGYFTELFVEEPYLSGVRAIALKKIMLEPHVAFLRSIAANWLVNVAMFMAAAAESVEGKIIASMIPITNFVAASFEHSVANMFFVSLGLMYGAESDFGTFLYRNLILVTIGNWIGGAVCVGALTWFVFIRDAPPPPPKSAVKEKTM